MVSPRSSNTFSALALIVVTLGAASVARAAPDNFVGVNAHVPDDGRLDAAVALGVSWIRIDVNWSAIQPSEGGPLNFSTYDTVVDHALARGLSVFATLAYAPAWAAEPDSDGKAHNNTPKPGRFRAISEAAAAHFAGKISHWGIWNEPNLPGFFEGTRDQWIDRIVLEGVAGIRAGCPACKVLGPEIASVGDKYVDWLEQSLVRLKQAGEMFDIITWHIYSTFVAVKPDWACWDGDLFLHDLDEQRTCFGFPVGYKPVRQVLVENGVGHLDLWVTETGYKAPLGSAEEPKQATYVRRVLEEQLRRPWYTHTFFYELADDINWEEKWGLCTPKSASAQSFPADYDLKAAWGLVQQALAAQPAFGGTGGDCQDGLDNDGDGAIDFPADPDCAAASGSEGPQVTVDGGAGGDSAAPGDGPTAPSDGGAPADGGATPDAGDGSVKPPADDDGCIVAGAPRSSPLPLLLLAALVLAAARLARRATRRRSGRGGA